MFTLFVFVFTSVLLNVAEPDEFYNITLAQLITPLLQALTLIGIAYYINVTIFKKNKEYEVLAELTDKILEKLEELQDEIEEYMTRKISDNETDESEEKILRLIRILSNKEIFQESMYKKTELTHLCKDRDIKKKIRSLKQSLTGEGDIFKVPGRPYTTPEKQKIRNQLREIINTYTEEKIYLYRNK